MEQIPLEGLYDNYIPEKCEYYLMEYYELDDVFENIFPNVGYEFAADEETIRDCAYIYSSIGIEDMYKWGEYEKTKWDNFIHKTKVVMYVTRQVLEWLVANKVLPPGDYLIKT